MPSAVILGGTGQIGLATARRLLGEAWDVTVVSRQTAAVPRGCRHIEADARDTARLSALVGSDTDLLLSCVAFDAADAGCLVRIGRRAGRIVAISSASVYRDEEGRTLDEAGECGFPAFPVPLTEQSPTVTAGPETYSTRKIAMENALLEQASCPVTILRPCAIHGPDSRHAREWWFVKRLLDGRTTIPLAYAGRSRFQTTSTTAIANAVLRAREGSLPPVANVSDADSPTVADIGRAIMDIMGVRAELVGLPDVPSYPPKLGATPWSIPRPMVCAGAAEAIYAQAVEPAVRWLVDNIRRDDWREQLPQLAAYPDSYFDYRADEQALRVPGAAALPA
jgi:nucleoside-diphosphate-sugar epimerase